MRYAFAIRTASRQKPRGRTRARGRHGGHSGSPHLTLPPLRSCSGPSVPVLPRVCAVRVPVRASLPLWVCRSFMTPGGTRAPEAVTPTADRREGGKGGGERTGTGGGKGKGRLPRDGAEHNTGASADKRAGELPFGQLRRSQYHARAGNLCVPDTEACGVVRFGSSW